MSNTTDKVTEKVVDTAADVAAEVKDQAAELEELIRGLNRAKVKFYSLGMVVGGITGAVIAYRIAYRKAETKYSKIADEEIAEMAKDYRERKRALESEAAKRPLEEIISERGYTPREEVHEGPPMAVQPPEAVVDEAVTETKITQRPPIPDVSDQPARIRNIFTEEARASVDHQSRDTSRDPNEEWDWHEERKKRSPDTPYVIHYDERHDTSGYQDVTLTYYSKDDVVCNERDEVMDPDERDTLIGEANLERFGHGSGDEEIVFVRNDKLEILFEICRSPNSYAEEVHGFSHEDLSYGNLERMRRREHDAPEE